MIDSFTAGLVITGLLLFVGHWFPWQQELHRLLAYTYGVTSILIGLAVWLTPYEQIGMSGTALFRGVALFAIVGGAATGAAYGIDWVLKHLAKDRIDERRPQG